MTNFLAGGGDGFAVLKNNLIEHTPAGNTVLNLNLVSILWFLFLFLIGMLDSDTIIRYMNKSVPITIGVERRIRFVNDSYRSPCSKALGDPEDPTNSAVKISNVPITLLAILTLIGILGI